MRRLLSFNFPNPECSQWAIPVHDTAQQAGWKVVWCDFSGDGAMPDARSSNATSPYCVVADRGLDSVQRLTHEEYSARSNDTIDFLEQSVYEIVGRGYPLDEQLLNPESVYRQRLRGYCHRLDQLMRVCQPDLVIVPHSVNVLSRLTWQKARLLQIPCLVRESPFFPGYCLLDAVGMHFYPDCSEIREGFRRHAAGITTEDLRRAENTIRQWKTDRASKYGQPSGDLPHELATRRSRGTRILFYPGQVPGDASLVYGLRLWNSLEEMEHDLLHALPSDVCLVWKPHPRAPSYDSPLLGDERVVRATHANIHDLITASDAVFVATSNVGLEAALYHRPIFCVGAPHYSGRGFTHDLGGVGELAARLRAPWQPADGGQAIVAYVSYLCGDYLFRHGDTQAFERKVERARRQVAASTAALPMPAVPERTADYLRMARQYEELAQHNKVHGEILTSLAERKATAGFSVHAGVKGAQLKTGERQVSIALSDIEVGYLARYDFARHMLGQRHRILDIACGVGYGSYFLGETTGASVLGVDSSVDAIEHARCFWRSPRVEYQAASCGHMQEHCRLNFDAIVSLETIEHLVSAASFVTWAWDRLGEGGMLAVSVPNAEVFPLLDAQFHVRHFTPKQLVDLVHLPGSGPAILRGQAGCEITLPNERSRFLLAIVRKGRPRDSSDLERLADAYRFQQPAERAEFNLPAKIFFAVSGTQRVDGIHCPPDAPEGFLFYGPYVRLPSASYTVVFRFAAGRLPSARTRVDVAYPTGRILASRVINDQCLGQLEFAHSSPDMPVEFRCFLEDSSPRTDSVFEGVTITRSPASEREIVHARV